mgnify:CR=1 FL=1
MEPWEEEKEETAPGFIWLCLFVGTLAVHGYSLRANCQKLATEQQNLKDKKKSLKKEQERIKEQKEYRKTDQYVEDVAREKFGLVYDNEIVFKAE